MKKIFLIAIVSCISFMGCTEVNDLIQLTPPSVYDQLAVDSTKYTAVPAQPKNVLIEDFTGVHCDNCPNAQKQSISIENANPGRVFVMGIHCTTTFGYPFPGHPDYRTPNGTNLVTYLLGTPGSLPTGDIDRKIWNFSGTPSIQLPYAIWPYYVDSQLAQTPKAAIAFNNKSYDAGSRTVSMDITTSFPQATTDTFYVTAALIESGFIDWQETTSGVNQNFVFEHVLRKLMNPYNGLKIVSSPAAGSTYSVRFSTKIDPSWNADSCKVVAFVHQRSPASNAVEQVQQTTIK